jgi:hypothetical protein
MGRHLGLTERLCKAVMHILQILRQVGAGRKITTSCTASHFGRGFRFFGQVV